MKKTTIGRGRARSLQPHNPPGRNFEKACAEIQASLNKFNFTDELSDDDSEEEQEKDKVLEKVLQSYQAGMKGDGPNHLERTQEFLVELLTSGGIVCLICIETIKKVEAIWSCGSCFGLFHLPCVQKWATDTIQQQQATNENTSIKPVVYWCCPKCRSQYGVEEKPNRYLCYCGKVTDPTFDPWLVPHSCGQYCGKTLNKCPHKCSLLCHPGPCPPCARTVRSSCHCGVQEPTTRRCSNKEWSCSKPCNKKLSCTQHHCKELCHSGDCSPCQKQSQQNCLCGRKSQLRPCSDPIWQCPQICGAKLSCGHHSCQIVCHQGKCGDCPRSGIRNCPCGKTKYGDVSCTDEVLPCGDTCDKVLECKLHRCSQRCHLGPCSQCLQVRVKRCRCGAKEKSVPCSKEFICETKCKNNRNCKKHSCNRKCCEGDCPPCEQICGRTLPCKNHKCNSQCHQGPCYPCPLKVTLNCNCGQTKLSVQCGRERLTKPPKCKQKCSKPPDCHHQIREDHRCHSGPCPICTQICALLLKPCKHSCPTKCHDQVKMTPKYTRAGPWEPVPAPTIESLPCPPCRVPMPLQCLGKHTVSDFWCSELRPWSCGRPCGVPLPCGNHLCTVECHPETSKHMTCEEPCSKVRECAHSCQLQKCHPGACPPCTQMSRRQCHCNITKLYILCSKLTQPDQQEDILSCQNRCSKLLLCSHRCPVVCHPGDCPVADVCKKKVVLRCPCKRIKIECPCNSKRQPDCDAECKRIQSAKELEIAECKKREELDEVENAKKSQEDNVPQKSSKRRLRDRRNQRSNSQDDSENGSMLKRIALLISLVVALFSFTLYLLNK